MRRTATAAALIALSLGLSACGDDPDAGTDDTNSKPPTSSASPSPSSASPSPSTTDAPPMASSSTEVQKTITDEEFGHTVFVDSYVRGFPFPEKNASLAEEYELVLVKVKLTAGEKFFGSLSGLDLRVLTENSDIPNTAFTLAAAEMAAANYTPIPEKGAEAGKSVEGYVAFRIEKDASDLTFRYVRLESKVLGGGKTIPRKEIDVSLTDE